MSEDAALWSRRNLLYHQTFAFFVTANILMSLWFLSLTDVTTKRFVYTGNFFNSHAVGMDCIILNFESRQH